MSLKKNATTLLVAIALLSFCLSPWVMAPDSNNVVINRFRTAGTSEIYLGSESSKMDVHDDSEKWWDLNGNRVSDILESEISVDQGKHGLCLLESGWNQDKLVALKETGVRIIGHYQDLGIVEISHPGFSALWDITGISEEIRIWHTGQLTWFGDVQTRNIKARESDEYSPNTAWELGYTGEGVSLCVMDTGVDDAHPSLSGKWLGGADISKPKTFLTPRDGSFNADDIQGHGTSCTGMAMGTGAPTGEFMGSAPGARLVDLRIGTAIGYAPGELFQDAYDASLQGSQWAFDHRNDNWPAGGGEYQGIDVLSLSWGIDIGGPSDGKDPYSMALDKLVEAGVVVGLGTDSCAVNDNMDMFEAMRTTAFLQKVTTMDPRVLPAEETLRMATLGGAEALGMEDEVGSLEEGKKADVLLIDLTGTHMRPINKIENSLVYAANASDVHTVICDGQIVMEDRKIMILDEETWVSEAVDYAYQRFTEAGIDLPNYYRLNY